MTSLSERFEQSKSPVRPRGLPPGARLRAGSLADGVRAAEAANLADGADGRARPGSAGTPARRPPSPPTTGWWGWRSPAAASARRPSTWGSSRRCTSAASSTTSTTCPRSPAAAISGPASAPSCATARSSPSSTPSGPTESPYVTWLRNHSNYLAERGFLDYARIVAVLLRGVLVNLLVLVPSLLLLERRVLLLAAKLGHRGFFDGTTGRRRVHWHRPGGGGGRCSTSSPSRSWCGSSRSSATNGGRATRPSSPPAKAR